MVLVKCIVYLIFVFLSAYFAAMETALMKSSTKKIFDTEKKIKEYLSLWGRNPSVILATILLGTNLACEGIGVLSNSLKINIIYSVFIILIFGEIIPKVLALRYFDKILNYGLKSLIFISKIFGPITKFLSDVSTYLLSFFISETSVENPFLSPEELREVINYDENVSGEEQQLYSNIIELADKRIYEIMLPKEEIVAIDYNLPLEEIVEKLKNVKYSRIPVFRGNIENIVGIIYTKDITVAIQNKSLLVLDDIIRPAYFVINTSRVVDILKQFKQGRNHIAIVVDEYGATVGLVTIEDIVEEIFGEIYDEYDIKEDKIVKVDSKSIVVEGDESLKNVNSCLGTKFQEDEVVTVNGYVVTRLGKVPQIGEKIVLEDVEVEVIDANKKMIKRLKLRKLD